MFNVHFEGSARGDLQVSTAQEAMRILVANVKYSKAIPAEDKPECLKQARLLGWVQYINGNKYFYGVIEEVR